MQGCVCCGSTWIYQLGQLGACCNLPRQVKNTFLDLARSVSFGWAFVAWDWHDIFCCIFVREQFERENDRTYFKHHAFIILGCHPVSQCHARMRVWNSLFTKGLGQLKGTKHRENIPCRLVNPRETEHSATLS